MKTIKIILLVAACLMTNTAFSQNYISYYPTQWDFRNQVDLIDFSQVKSLTIKELTVEESEEHPLLETHVIWNNNFQLTDYQFVNYNNSYADFDIRFNYADAHSKKLKSVQIINPNTLKTVEDWQYTYGGFDVEKIKVKRYLLNVPEPDVFEVKYEGNDDDYTQETVYNPQNSVVKRTAFWYKANKDGTTLQLSKLYVDDILDQTDSLLLDKNGKKLANYVINLGISDETKYNYKIRKVDVAGDEFDYQELERIQRNGKDIERYEYQYDAKGNWTERKTYQMKNGKWQYTKLTRRVMEYRN